MAAHHGATEVLALGPAVIDALADRLSEAVAERVLELIREQGLEQRRGDAEPWLDAHQVAKRFGVSRDWVYEHADELGAVRIGGGRRPRLRFPRERFAAGNQTPSRHGERRARRPPASPYGLIPIDDSA